MRAYVLLKVMPQHMTNLMHDLKDNSHVREASLIHGHYDCLALVQGKDLDEVNDVVLKVRQMTGVTESSTHLIVQFWERTGE